MNALTVAETREVRIPFPGFYDSCLSEGVDHAEEQDTEYLTTETGAWDGRYTGVDPPALADARFWATDYSAVYLTVAADYLSAWAHILDSDHDVPMHVDFAGMESPREYNFTTDRLFARVTLEAVRYWHRRTPTEMLRSVARERHTSRPGFISFYSNDPGTWGAVEEWDHNQLETLLIAYMAGSGVDLEAVERSTVDSLYESNAFDDALGAWVDWDGVDKRLAAAVATREPGTREDSRTGAH